MTPKQMSAPAGGALDRPDKGQSLGESAIGDVSRGLYRVAPWVVVRTPALPALQVNLARTPRLALDDPYVVRALGIGCPDLLDTLRRPTTRNGDRKRAERSLARYLIRMSTRPTPFGTFAGVSMAGWAARTSLALDQEQAPTTRPDMAWVLGLLRELEADPDIRAQRQWQRHPLLFEQDGRFWTHASGASIRATDAARAALIAAHRPISYSELSDRVREQTHATDAHVNAQLTEMWRCGLLLTDLRPQLTGRSATSGTAIADLVRPLRPATSVAISALLQQMDSFDRAPVTEAPTRLPQIVEAAKAISPAADAVFQTDLRRSLTGDRLSHKVGIECARAAELLLRLTPAPGGSGGLASYARSFVTRYGEDGQVLLPELFDPTRGLGPMPHTHTSAAGVDASSAAERDSTRMTLALSAIRHRRRTIELDTPTIQALQTWSPHPDHAPLSLDLSAFVIAADPAAVDDGDFQVVIGPNLGAASAGRWLGRFAHLFGPEADRAYAWLLEAESDARPGPTAAEVVYLPSIPRSTNVVLRPTTAPYQIIVDAPTLGKNDIGLDDLVVGVRDKQFYLWSVSRGCEIRPTARHMLNHHGAPPVCQFLDEVARGGEPVFSGFDWGPANTLPYLPRVQSGRAVLEPARWLIPVRAHDFGGRTGGLSRFRASLATTRERWEMPSRVYVSTADNRMLLDLDDSDDVEQLYREARNLAGGNLQLHEALPDLSDAWLPGPDGGYLSEIVVSLVLRPTTMPRWAPASPPRVTAQPAASALKPTQMADRVRPPGSDWLFVKLYTAGDNINRLLSGPVGDLLQMVENSGLARRWFFLRYADPTSHLRIRWQGDPDVLLRHLLPHVATLTERLIQTGHLNRFVIDTYDRELERYGGLLGTNVSEDIFHADSRAVHQLITLAQMPGGIDLTELATLTVQELLAGLGLDAEGRLGFYLRQTGHLDDEAMRRNVGMDYRQRKTRLRRVLGSHRLDDLDPSGQLASILATRRRGLEEAARQLADIGAIGSLTSSMDSLHASYVHMHLNRLVNGSSPPSEGHVLHLLARAQKSLLMAPVAGDGTPGASDTVHDSL